MSTPKQKPPAPLCLGLDLGGTNIKAGIVDAAGKLRSFIQIPTGTDLSPRAIVARLVIAATQAITKATPRRLRHAENHTIAINALGIVCPGLLNPEKGTVLRAANFPTWRNVPLRDLIRSACQHLTAAREHNPSAHEQTPSAHPPTLSACEQTPSAHELIPPAHPQTPSAHPQTPPRRPPHVTLANDANAAAFAEVWVGAARATHSSVTLTLGTGVGAGIIQNGRLTRGAFGGAGEIGHMILIPGGEPCPCGQRGCVEQYCSATALAARVRQLLADTPRTRRTSSLSRATARGEALTAAAIARHARAGDPLARAAWRQMCSHLALACLNIARIIDPEMIILAGGLAGAGPLLLNTVRRELKAHTWKLSTPQAQLALGTLGPSAGVIGAAGLAMSAH